MSGFNAILLTLTLRKKCPYSELFWSAFSCIRTEYGQMRSISPYSVRMRENVDQNNSEYGHFLRSVRLVFSFSFLFVNGVVKIPLYSWYIKLRHRNYNLWWKNQWLVNRISLLYKNHSKMYFEVQSLKKFTLPFKITGDSEADSEPCQRSNLR